MSKVHPWLWGAICGLVVLFTVPWRIQAWGWGDRYQGELAGVRAQSDQVAAWVETPLERSQFKTGSERFDAEWLFGSTMMAAMGFGQVAYQYPELKAESLARMDRCIARLMLPELQAFDTEAWGESALQSLDGPNGHAGYLGYFGVVLAFRQHLAPDPATEALSLSVIAALERRFEAAPFGLIETYPSEGYPLDNTTALAALAIFRRSHPERAGVIEKVLSQYRNRYLHNGLMTQAADARTGQLWDQPRGSSSFFGAWYMSFVDPTLARSMYLGSRDALYGEIAGFGMMREYRRGEAGSGDIDSGPVILGYGISATGFALAGARQWQDEGTFLRIGATANLFGVPTDAGFLTGGPIGNAILFAMSTAIPGGLP